MSHVNGDRNQVKAAIPSSVVQVTLKQAVVCAPSTAPNELVRRVNDGAALPQESTVPESRSWELRGRCLTHGQKTV